MVNLTLSGKPTGVTASFNPTAANSSSVLTLNVTNAATPGNYQLTVKGKASGKIKTVVFFLEITAVPDTTKPKIVSVSPANNSTGIADNVKIVVTFSEPMNKFVSKTAYQSVTDLIKPNQVTFSWNVPGTVLTIKPKTKLKYKEVTFPAYTAKGYQYIFNITNAARDLAGNQLANPQTIGFRTLLRETHTFYSDADGFFNATGFSNLSGTNLVVGDGPASISNAQYKAFVGFNISGLPGSLTKIEKATFYAYQYKVDGHPYNDLSDGGHKLEIKHVYFNSLDFSDFNTPVLHDEGNLSTSAGVGFRKNDVTVSVRDDWAKKSTRANKSQYMLSFPKSSDLDGKQDLVSFYSKEKSGSKVPKLVVVYLRP